MQPLGTNDPARIGDYRLLGVLGAGGMGRVYLGRNAGGRTVAVKVIRPDMIDAEFRQRFRREVAAARRVGGQFTAPVLDADVDADPPWLATGYVAGFALSDAVDRYGPLTENALLVLAHGLIEAVTAVHRAGVVHRDLKPSNVLLALDGPKVIDFGIARAADDSKLTTTGKVIGSPGFMCPEQVTGDPVGPQADVFALGGVLVFAATGHGPFGVGETMQILWRVMYEEPQLDDVPERLRPLVAACLTKDAAARPTPDQLLTQLTALGIPERGGWLPAPVLEEVSRRAVELLNLDSGAFDHVTRSAPADSARTADTMVVPAAHPHTYSDPGRSVPTQMQYLGSPQASPAFMAHETYPPAHHSSPRFGAVAAAPPPRRPGRALLIAGALVVCAAVAVAAFVVGVQLRNDDSNRSIAQTTRTDSAPSTTTIATQAGDANTTTSSPSGTSIPKAFVGEWKGVARDVLASFDIVLTIRDGTVGEEVAQSSNTGKLKGERCERTETLTGATETELSFVARLSGGSPTCFDNGSTSTVRLQPDGSLAYSLSGILGNIEGVLHKS
ncbi:serine/threonine protein kinase [Nocardia beijingensis]|uniref:serine/threonine-protein kinase n=1 Tax=Nocardia beijingensis TaxID=95162 RepID=UPI0018942E3E|nr:serine/threonine-protein kinase [Nocardia beijingensis]MBF6468662.1 serine/threonine protein kinase [Nocardia beijingensis]